MIPYPGSKRRFLAGIMPIITEHSFDGQLYVEPFAGGCNSLLAAPTYLRKWGIDSNAWVVAALNAGMRGHQFFAPCSVEFKAAQERYRMGDTSSMEQDGFTLQQFSFSRIWYRACGYTTDRLHKPDGTRDPAAGDPQKKVDNYMAHCMELAAQGVTLTAGDYRRCSHVTGAIVYCDPPYLGSDKAYATEFKGGCEREFIAWVKQMAAHNHVYVSNGYRVEDQAFELRWQSTLRDGLGRRAGGTRTEYLYKIKAENNS